MKKLFIIFLFAQMLLVSIIFNQSVYDIVELNNVGDPKLEGYALQEFTGEDLNQLFDEIMIVSEQGVSADLQLIKTPVTQDQTMLYDIYHNNVADLDQVKSIKTNRLFIYHTLTKEDFVDSNGIFYTDLPRNVLDELTNELGLSLTPYEEHVSYSQIVWQNSLNLGLLILLTIVVFFIYTFTRVKRNAVKKLLGFSNINMVSDTLQSLLYIEGAVALITLAVHILYYSLYSERGVVGRYFLFLVIFLIGIITINFLLFLLTQIHVKFIDIQLMMKNKVYSSRLNTLLYFTKVILILTITVSVSYCLQAFQSYRIQQEAMEKYTQLDGYFTSSGFNSNEYDQMMQNPELMGEYSERTKQLYQQFDSQNELYILDDYVTVQLSSDYLERFGLQEQDIYNSASENYVVANERYINEFMSVKDTNGELLTELQSNRPLIIVPEKHRQNEQEIRALYQEKISEYYNYDQNYGVREESEVVVEDIDIVYAANDQEFSILGQFDIDDDISNESEISLKNPIIIVDQGEFDGLYYLDLLNASNFYVKLDDREIFSAALISMQMDALVNVATLLTPLNDSIYFVQFILYNTFIFSVLFLATLLFVIVISNYVDIVSNRRKYTTEYIFGFSLWKTAQGQIIVSICLLFGNAASLFIEFNPIFYTTFLIIDFIVLLLVYQYVIKRDLYQIVKGG